MRLWQYDVGWRKGNWDLRSEYCQNFQEAETYIGNNIIRTGMYAQVAYRPFDAVDRLFQKMEFVYRYSNARFSGIDFSALDLSAFADSPVDAPVNRDQHTVGINYYFYPSMVLKLAYEVNVESAGVNLHDNVFLAQFAWGF
jgi:phosphate-selective porin